MRVGLRERDAAARQLAQSVFDRPLLLEAGAGTGKTAVLVARVVAWCLGPGWEKAAARRAASGSTPPPEAVAAEALGRVVAITFTEAASAEMASRVGDALLRIRKGDPPPGIHEEALPSPPEERARRAGALVSVLDQLQVSTIHSFCRRLLAAHPLEAGLHPDLHVDADSQRTAEVVRGVIEAVLDEAYLPPGVPDFLALADQDVGPAALEEAVVALLAEGARAEDLHEEAIGDAAAERFAASLTAALERFVAAEAGRFATQARARKSAEVAEALRRLHARLVEGGPWSANALGALCDELRELDLEAVSDKLASFAKADFSQSETVALDTELEALVAAARQLRPLLEHAARLDLPTLSAARRVLAALLAEAEARLRAEGVVTFGGLLRGARDLLRENPAVADRERRAIDQLLVDEFQDTDALQCELLHILAMEGPPRERPGLFLVGDPKQSIYGFRRADLRAYEDFRRRLRAENPDGVQPLAVNFRSVPPILAEVRRIVAPVMREEPGLQPAFEDLLPSEVRAASPGFAADGFAAVERWVTARRDAKTGAPALAPSSREAAEIEARAVAADIQRLHRQHAVAYGEVALLFRTRSDVETYLDALRSAGIPFVMEREPDRHRRREVIEAEALVRCVLDPLDVVALVAVLRSAAVGVPDAALIPLWRRQLPRLVAALPGSGEEGRRELEKRVAEAAAAMPKGVPGLSALEGWEHGLLDFLDDLAALRTLFATTSPERFVEVLRTRLLFEVTEAARSLGAWRVATLDGFFRDLIDALEEHGGSAASVTGYLRRARSPEREQREGRARALEGDAVQVMTIHGAKGLQFGHVYLLQTHKRSGGGSRGPGTRVWNARFPAEEEEHAEYVLFERGTPGLPALAAEWEAMEARERVRLLYVAATRARERLVLAGRWVDPPLQGQSSRPEEWTNHAQLLSFREGAGEVAARLQTLGPGDAAFRDQHGVLWRLAGDARGPEPAASAAAAPTPGEVAKRARQDAALLAGRSQRAVSREARSFSSAASEAEDEHALRVPPEAHEAEGPVVALGWPDRESDAARRLALAAGTAVHAGLESLDLSVTDVGAWREAFLGGARTCLATVVGPAEEGAVRGRVEEVWRRLEEGPLLARLQQVAGGVVARELPVLLAPEEGPGAPVGFVSGAIDLLYRDPVDGAWAVADYKTDAVEDGPDLEERVRAYAPQGEVYVRAVQRALGLARPPRFELWFLHAGVIRRTEPAS